MAVGSSCGDVTADQSRECGVHAGVPAMQPGMQLGMPPAKRPRMEGCRDSPGLAFLLAGRILHQPRPSFRDAEEWPWESWQSVGSSISLLAELLRFLKMLVTNATAGILIGKGGLALKDLT